MASWRGSTTIIASWISIDAKLQTLAVELWQQKKRTRHVGHWTLDTVHKLRRSHCTSHCLAISNINCIKWNLSVYARNSACVHRTHMQCVCQSGWTFQHDIEYDSCRQSSLFHWFSVFFFLFRSHLSSFLVAHTLWILCLNVESTHQQQTYTPAKSNGVSFTRVAICIEIDASTFSHELISWTLRRSPQKKNKYKFIKL